MPLTTVFARQSAPPVSGPTTPIGNNLSSATLGSASGTHGSLVESGTGGSGWSSLGFTAAQNVNQNTFMGDAASSPLGAQTIPAGTWTIGLRVSESNSAANQFITLAIGIYRPSDQTSKLIYDNTNALGAEIPTSLSGRVISVSGVSVTCQSGDLLIVEYYLSGQPSMSTSYSINMSGDNTETLITNGSSTGTMFVTAPAPLVYQSEEVTVTSVSSSDTSSISIAETTATTAGVAASDAAAVTIIEASTNDPFGTLAVALSARETKRVNIGILGASVTEGYPGPFVSSVEYALANKLRSAYPTTGNPSGRGYMGPPSWTYYNTGNSDVVYNGTGATYNEVIGWGGRHGTWYAPPGAQAVIYFYVANDITSFDIDLVIGPGGASNGGYVQTSVGATNFNNYAPTLTRAKANFVINVPGGTWIMLAPGPGGTDNFIVNGVTLYSGDESKGIIVHNFGHSGYTVADWVRNDGGRPDWLDDIIAEDLDTLVLGEFGINDGNTANPAPITAAAFKTAYGNFIDAIRARGYTKPILCVGAYDTSAAITFVDPWDNYVTAIRDTAKAKGCGFVDLRDTMPASPDNIYADGVHSNVNGAAAFRYADAIIGALTDVTSDSLLLTVTEASSITVVSSATPITSSDTGAITVGESAQIGDASSRPDSSAVTITESSSVVISSTRVDTSAITVTESKLLSGSSISTETESVTISEGIILGRASTITESEALSIAEVSSLASSSGRADSSAITIVETTSGSNTAGVSESESLIITDSSSLAILTVLATSESNSLSVSESSSLAISNTLPGNDIAAVTIVDTSNISGTAVASEPEALSVSDTSTSVIIISRTDGASISVGDISVGQNSFNTTDTSAISVSDASAAAVSGTLVKTATDSASITVGDVSNQAIITAVVAVETEALTIAESRTLAGSSTSSEAMSISIADTSISNATLSSTESEALTFTENVLAGNSSSTSDTSSIAVIDSSSLIISNTLPGAENIAVTVSESANVSGSGNMSYSDNAAVSISEAITLFMTINTNDNAAITIVDSSTSSITITGVESPSISISDVTVGTSNSFNASESESLTITESHATTAASIASETESLTITESRSAALSSNATESIAMTITETRVPTITESSTESEAISITEASVLTITTTALGNDTITATIAESALINITNSSDDAGSVSIGENISLNNSSTRADGGGIGIGETITIGVTQTTSDIVVVVGDENSGINGHVVDNDILVIESDDVAETSQLLDVLSSDILSIVATESGIKFLTGHNQPYLFHNGLWAPGTPYIYNNGEWRFAPLRVLRDGIWT